MQVSLKTLCHTLFEAAASVAEVNVFDFDDTLVRTTSYIYLTKSDGKQVTLTPGEYAMYNAEPGDVFDFSDFKDVKNPTPISHMLLKLKFAVRTLGPNNVFILTARGAADPIIKFLDGVGVSGIRVVALNSGDPQAKATVIRNEILRRGVKIVKFFDDSAKNVAAVRELRRDPAIPDDVQILSVRV